MPSWNASGAVLHLHNGYEISGLGLVVNFAKSKNIVIQKPFPPVMLLGWCVCVCACMCWWAGGAPNSHHPKLPSPFVDGVGLSSSSTCFWLLLATGTVTNRRYRYYKYDDHSCHYYMDRSYLLLIFFPLILSIWLCMCMWVLYDIIVFKLT